ncbi:MAG: helix-turn-helix transcriptional regulator [Clostridia bacterium]|nr:helix-turn-helix transcriptional regulator [Clostridia bacterium]
MLFEKTNPFIRFVGKWSYDRTKKQIKTYDCRLLYFQSGSGYIVVNNTEYKIEPRLFVVFQPGTLYSLIPDPVFDAIVIDFDYTDDFSNESALIIPVASDCFNETKSHGIIEFEDFPALNSHMAIPQVFHIRSTLNELCEEFNRKQTFYMQKSSLLLKNVIYEALRQKQSASGNITVAQNLIDFISENYMENLTNSYIADNMHYSAGYLNRLILAHTGMSMHQYIINLRIDAAIKMLAMGNMTIAEIASKTGFYSTSHFSNAFKSATGIRPSAYVKGI